MKKYLTLVIAAILSSAASFGQWVPLHSGTTSTLYSVFFTDANHGVVVGENGRILLTTDGGAHWSAANSGTSNTLMSVYFSSDSIGYAAGDAGTIIKTHDGGQNWTTLSSGTNVFLSGISFVSDTAGFAAGYSGTILRTSNGGNTWTLSNSGTTPNQDINGLFFLDASHGYAPTSDNPEHGVLVSTDGGMSWQKDTLGLNIPEAVFFTDAATGFAAGTWNFIWKTNDGGQHWHALDSASWAGCYYGIFFTNASDGYFVGGLGTIRETNDAGGSWFNEQTDSSICLYSIYFPNLSIGYTVGQNGEIFKKGGGAAIHEFSNNDNIIVITPNPANDNITIKTAASLKETVISIYNMQGRLLMQCTGQPANTSINISSLNNGMYILKLNNAETIEVTRFVKE